MSGSMAGALVAGVWWCGGFLMWIGYSLARINARADAERGAARQRR